MALQATHEDENGSPGAAIAAVVATSGNRLLRGCEINPSWPPKLPWGGSEWREWIDGLAGHP